MDISLGQSRKDCQVLNLCEHAGRNLPWLRIWPPASVQSRDVHQGCTCFITAGSAGKRGSGHTTCTENLSRAVKIWLEGHCGACAAYSCPDVLPNMGLPCLFLILGRSKLHTHLRGSISGLTAASSSSCLICTSCVHAQNRPAPGIRLPLRPLPSHRHTAHTPSLHPPWGGCSVSSFASSSKKINK